MKAVVKKRVLKKRSGRIVPGRRIFGCGLPDFVGGTFQGARRLNQAAQAGKAGRCGHEQHDAEKDEVEKNRGGVCLAADVGNEYAHADGQSRTEDRDSSSQIQDDSPFCQSFVPERVQTQAAKWLVNLRFINHCRNPAQSIFQTRSKKRHIYTHYKKRRPGSKAILKILRKNVEKDFENTADVL